MQNLSKVPVDSITFKLIDNGWFYEKHSDWPGLCLGLQIQEIIAFKKSQYQEIFIFDSTDHGRVLVHDGIVQLNSLEEFAYHEMMTHVPMFAHQNPKSILVIGGGDGGCVAQLIKHTCVQQITWVEIDGDVVNMCKKWFPDLFNWQRLETKSLKPKLELIIGDGIDYVTKCQPESFDIIIVDSSDPVRTSPSQVLFSKQFYQNCYRILNEDGIICCQNECIFSSEESSNDWSVILRGINDLKSIFKNDTRYFTFYTPMYISGQLGGLMARKCSKRFYPVAQPVRRIPDLLQTTLNYYTKQIHGAAFVLPRFAEQKILNSKL